MGARGCLHRGWVGLKLREERPHLLHNEGHELGEEPRLRVEVLASVAACTADDALEDIVAALVADVGAVGEGCGTGSPACQQRHRRHRRM